LMEMERLLEENFAVHLLYMDLSMAEHEKPTSAR